MLSAIRASFKSSRASKAASPRRWSKLQILFFCIYAAGVLRITIMTFQSSSFSGPGRGQIAAADPRGEVAVVAVEPESPTEGNTAPADEGQTTAVAAANPTEAAPPTPEFTVRVDDSENALASAIEDEVEKLVPPPGLSPSEQRAWRLKARRKIAVDRRRRARAGALDVSGDVSVVQRIIDREIELPKRKTVTPQAIVWAVTDSFYESSQHRADRTLNAVTEALPKLLAAASPRFTGPTDTPPAEPAWSTLPVTATPTPESSDDRSVVIHNPSTNQGVVRFLVDGREVSLSAGEERRWTSDEPIRISYHRGGTLGDMEVVAERGDYQFFVSRRGWRLEASTENSPTP